MDRHVAVVGAGVIGCSIALELRRRGFAVSVIDRNGAGYVVSPGVATRNLRLAGEREGVRFLLNRQVRAIRPAGPRRFRVETEGREAIECDVLVNAAGPHSGIVNRMAGVSLPLETRPLRKEVHALPNPLHGQPGGAALPVVGDLDGGVYFRPEAGGRELVVGSTDPECDPKDFVADPDDFGDRITELYRERQCLRLMQRFPAVRLGPRDTDRDPVSLTLPRIGVSVDTRFLSRRRGELQSTGTVIG